MQNLKKLKEQARFDDGFESPDSPVVAVAITGLQKDKKHRKKSFLPQTKPTVAIETSFSVPIQVEENTEDVKKPTKRRVSKIVMEQPQISEDETKKETSKEIDQSGRKQKITASRRTRSVSQAKQLEDALTIFESFKSTLRVAEETKKIQKPKVIKKRMKKQKKEEPPQQLTISVPMTTITDTTTASNEKGKSKSVLVTEEKKTKPKHQKTNSDVMKPTPVVKQSSLNNFLNKALKTKNAPVEEDEIGSPSSVLATKSAPAPEPKKKTGLFSSLFGKNKKKEKKVEPPPPEESSLKESGGMLGVTRFIRTAVSLNKKRFNEGGFDLDLSYITPQLIAMGYPSSGLEGAYRNPLPEVQEFFETRHPGKYKLYNLCEERNYDPELFKGRVENFGFADHNPPPLFIMKPIMQNIRDWIKHDGNVAVIHCKAGKGRTGTIIAAYLMDCGFCDNAEEAMEFFGLKRTKDGKGVTIPSQRRYVHYYEKCLKFGFPKVDKKLIITEIKWSRPVFESCGKKIYLFSPSNIKAPNFKIFYLGQEVYDFSKKIVGDLKEFDPEEYSNPIVFLLGGPTIVKGDVKIVFFFGKEKKGKFHFWFNTNMVGDGNHLVLRREEMDGGVKKDKKMKLYPLDFAISVKFKNP